MVHFDSPALVYSKEAKIPVFSYRLVGPDFTIARYRWLKSQGTSFSFYDAEILERGNHEGFERRTFRNERTKVKGHYKELEEVLRGNVERDALLPDADKLVVRFGREVSLLHDELGVKEHHHAVVADFCRIVNAHFDAGRGYAAVNDTERFAKLFKGTTFGRSRTIHAFFMKAIKSAHEAFGFYRKTYKLVRFSNFGMNDLVSYVRGHREAWPTSIRYDFQLIPGFRILFDKEVGEWDIKGPLSIPNVRKEQQTIPAEYLKLIKKTMGHWKTSNKLMPNQDNPQEYKPSEVIKSTKPVIVNEYAFRGDTRGPLVLFHSGGLHPNTIRYYEDTTRMTEFEGRRRDLLKKAKDLYGHRRPHFDPYLHQHEFDAISVFLSVTRKLSIARSFAVDADTRKGYIYLLRCPGAIDQEATFAKAQHEGERELSIPGGLDWDDVIAVRPIRKGFPMPFCFVNDNNPWRAKERAIQDAGIYRLMKFDDIGDVWDTP